MPGLVAERLVEVAEGEPTTDNASALAEGARPLLPGAGFDLAAPMRSCGSDDFGFYGRLAPALTMFVGLRDGPGVQDLPLHHPRFLPPIEAVGAVARPGRRLHGRDSDSLAFFRSQCAPFPEAQPRRKQELVSCVVLWTMMSMGLVLVLGWSKSRKRMPTVRLTLNQLVLVRSQIRQPPGGPIM